jgi:hypothetical protein
VTITEQALGLAVTAWPYPGAATVHALVSALGLDGEPVGKQAQAVRQFTETPAWEYAPPVLQRDVRRWLGLLWESQAELSITGQAAGLGDGVTITGQLIDLVGPKGYIHGWIYVGGPGLPSVQDHNTALRKKGITPPTKAHPALTREPPAAKAVPAKTVPGPEGRTTAPQAKAAAGAKAEAPQAKTVPAPQKAPQEPKLSAKEKKRLTDMWTSSYRYSGTSFYAGTDRSKIAEGQKRGQEFAGELHRLLATNKPPVQCGPGCQDAHKFLAMVDRDSTVQHKEMQRGLDLPAADAKRLFQPGKPVDMPAASWTTSPDVSKGYAGSEASPGKTRIILHTAPPAKGLDLQRSSQSGITAAEAEVVTGGRYSVESVKSTGGVMHVYLTQKDFSAH